MHVSKILLNDLSYKIKHIQTSMLGNYDNNKIFICDFYQELLQTTMLAFWIFVIFLLTISVLVVIADIQC